MRLAAFRDVASKLLAADTRRNAGFLGVIGLWYSNRQYHKRDDAKWVGAAKALEISKQGRLLSGIIDIFS